ncbi:hypothetical protein B7463_g6640, partial [Scytalidium lignicola]
MDDQRGTVSRRRRQITERDKKKRYLQWLEAIARRQNTTLDLSSTRIDHFTEPGCQGGTGASGGLHYNDRDVQGSPQVSFSPTYSPVNQLAGDEGILPGILPVHEQFAHTNDESRDQPRVDTGPISGSHLTPLTIDSSITAYSDDIFTWPLNNLSQDIVGIEASIYSNNRQEDTQQNLPSTISPIPLISSRLVDSQLLEDITNQKVTLQAILLAGIRSLSKNGERLQKSTFSRDPENEAQQVPTMRSASDHCNLPDIRMNTIQLTTISFVAACMSNAAMLGLSLVDLMNKESQSPFYRAQISQEIAQTACDAEFVHLKPQLRPSAAQLLHPHHPYLDILPFPVFRNCAIQLLQIQPSPFDPNELCQDLQSDGLICWGSTPFVLADPLLGNLAKQEEKNFDQDHITIMAPRLQTRQLGRNGLSVTALGFGTMGLSAYCFPAAPGEERLQFLDYVYNSGSHGWDTADVYGDSEVLLGKWFAKSGKRSEIFLATKGGGGVDANGKAYVRSDPEYVKEACNLSLKRLGVDFVDLYYIHRLDKVTPIEKTVAAMVDLKNEVKIRYFGLSECSAITLRRACKIHQISAVQIEYNPFSLDIEQNGLLEACRELSVAVVCYAPLSRGH